VKLSADCDSSGSDLNRESSSLEDPKSESVADGFFFVFFCFFFVRRVCLLLEGVLLGDFFLRLR
jgi:hypothetical protein